MYFILKELERERKRGILVVVITINSCPAKISFRNDCYCFSVAQNIFY